MISHEELKTTFNYNPETGEFIWIKNKGKVIQGSVAGGVRGKSYLTVMLNGKTYLCHRLAWFYFYGEWPKGQIDHINCIKTDNRISNLRDVSAIVNMQNKKKALSSNKSTGILGVTKLEKNGKFLAQIRLGNKKINLGLHQTAELASQAYLNAKRKYHAGCTI